MPPSSQCGREPATRGRRCLRAHQLPLPPPHPCPGPTAHSPPAAARRPGDTDLGAGPGLGCASLSRGRATARPSLGLSSPRSTTGGLGGSGAETPAFQARRPAGGRGAPRDGPPRDRPLPLLRPPARPGPAGSGARPPHHGGRGAGADGAQLRTRSSSRWRRRAGGAGLSGQRAGGAKRTRPPVIVNWAATRALGLCSLPALSSGL